MSGESKRFLGKYDHKKLEWLQLFKEIVIVAFVAVLVFLLVVGISRVDGKSMYPTLDDNQVVLYLKIGSDYDYGDVIAIKMPTGEKYVKRVVGCPGDEIDIRDGIVYRNGTAIDEVYLKDGIKTEPENARVTYPYVVSPGAFFVLGDNRDVSVDSREFGQVIKEDIRGKLIYPRL